jgi:uncharacterized damage-inducible protein DinB
VKAAVDSEVQSLLNELSAIHAKAKAAVEKLGDAGVAWQPPAPETNQAAVIVTHMCGSEAQWIGEYAGGRAANRNRESEFKQPTKTAVALAALLDRTEAATRAALAGHTAESLSRSAITGRADFKGTVRDCVLHAITHESEHAGHLELTEQLWRARK